MTVAPPTSMTCVSAPANRARMIFARAARDDAAVVDRDRFDDAEVRVDGEDFAVGDDCVDLSLRASGAAGESGDGGDDLSEPREVHAHCLERGLRSGRQLSPGRAKRAA